MFSARLATKRPVQASLSILLLILGAPLTAQATDVELTSTYSAADRLASIDELRSLSEAWINSDFDTVKAARVEGFVFSKDAGKLTLDGYLFIREPVQGMLSDLVFFGTGKFELRAPIKMERQQVERFFGSDEIDIEFHRASIGFTSVEDQLRIQDLDFTTAIAEEAKKEHDDAKEWADIVDKRKGREPDGEEEAQRRFSAHYTALNLYERLLYQDLEGGLTAQMRLKRPDGVEQGERYMDRVSFRYNPDADEETTVSARFDHGKRKPWSTVCQFATSSEYKGRFKSAGTSPSLETKVTAVAQLVSNTLVMRMAPGKAKDTQMTAVQDLRFLQDNTKLLHIYVSPLLHATSLKLDGKDWDFTQPKIPGAAALYSRVISIPLPKAYTKDEHVKLEFELEGNLLTYWNGTTYLVNDTDTWFPTPTQGLVTHPTIFETTMILPKKFVGIGPGEELPCDKEYESPDSVCQHFKTTRPIAMATFNLAKDTRIDRGEAPDGTPVLALTNASTGPAVVNKARAALAIYEEWFGEYPYSKLALMPNPSSTGRGFPSLLLLWDVSFMSKVAMANYFKSSMARPYWVDAFISHETAHQWWGHVAGIRSGRDQWFSEGFADYASLIYLEAVDQATGTDWRWQQLEEWHEALMVEDGGMHDIAPLSQANRVSSAENTPPFNRNIRQTYMYNKGGFVMHMLRTHARYMTGDDRKGDMLFKKAVRDFLDSCYGGFPSNLDMQNSMKESFGVNMSWFFKQWVHGLGVPKLTFSHEVVKNPEGGFLLRGRVEQRGSKFKFALPVYIHASNKADRDSPHLYVWISKADETFEIPLETKPGLVTVNDDLGVLCSLETTDWQSEVAGQ